MDIFGTLLKETPSFRGKSRLQRLWQRKIYNPKRLAHLPCGMSVETDLAIPYERQVWLKAEEWDDLIFLRQLLSAGEQFVDVGANIGLWTLTAAEKVGENGRIFSFEPNPATFTKLQKNVERNKIQERVLLYQCAVSSKSGSEAFFCASEHNVSQLAEHERADAITVRIVDLDSLLEGAPCLNRIAGIKIDVEGHEFEVLKGAERTIRKHNPWIIVEFNTTSLQSKAISDWSVYNHLLAHGYRAWTYDKTQIYSLSPAFALDGYTNILFRKSDND